MGKTSDLLQDYPDEILNKCSQERLEKLRGIKDPARFLTELREFASESAPVWSFGLHRSGSTWLGEQFLNCFLETVYKEPFDLFQSAGQKESYDKLHLGSAGEAPRPKIQKKLELTQIPLDRLILAIHDRFWFYHHLDSAIIDQLEGLYPRSKFMFWYRDLRDIIDSYAYPVKDHWPQKKFPYLGENPRERFLGALNRIISWTKMHLQAVNKYKDRMFMLNYENFTSDFLNSGARLLDYLGVDYSREELEREEEKFSARHGMWENWDDWELSLFYHTQARDLNRVLGYASGGEKSSNSWDKPIPTDRLLSKEETEELINEIQK